MNTRTNLLPAFTLALTLVGAALTMTVLAGAPPPRPQGPCDIYAAAGTPCVAAHSTTRALSAVVQRPALPGQAPVGRQDPGHRRRPARRRPGAGCGRIRRRGRAGRVLRQHDLRHQPHLRPVRQGQPPLPGASRTAVPGPGEGRIRHPADRGHGADHDRRPQGLRRLHHAGHGVPQQRRQRPRDRRRAGGHLLRRRRHALRQRLLLRLRQLPRPTAAPWAPAPWRPPTSAPPPPGAAAAAPARGSWPTWRPACSPDTTRSRTSPIRPSIPGGS